jgi:type II secretory pathway component PulK
LLLPEFLQSSKLQQAKPKELSTTFWVAATLGVRLADSNLQQLVQHFVQMLPQAKPQDISNTLWAMATLRVQLAR